MGVARGPLRPSNGVAWPRWAAHEGRTGAASSLSFPRESGARYFSISSRRGATSRPHRPRLPQQKQPPQKQEAETLATLFEQRKYAFIGLTLAAAVIGGYIAILVVSIIKGPKGSGEDEDNGVPSGRPLDLRQGRISATAFDRDLNWPETLTGVKGLRQLMGSLARGHVLEVAVGTGRNLEYIDWDEIRATAPPIVTGAHDGVREVKSEGQLAKERRLRRMEKGQRGVLLPEDEVPEVLSYTGVDVSTDVLEVAWIKLRSVLPELVPRRQKQPKKEGGAQQPPQQPQENQESGTVGSWLGKAAAGIIPTSSPATTTPPSSSMPSSPVHDGDITLAANIGQGRIRLYKADAQTRLPPPPAMASHDGTKTVPAPPYYDTILQNFGLCSVSDPQRMLANMAALLQPASGRIYLLEHGRGKFGWLNGLLDKFAPAHFRRFGCWWNRDIEAIVRKAEEEVPGLEVVKIDRPLLLQGGTMIYVELRVNPNKILKGATGIGQG